MAARTTLRWNSDRISARVTAVMLRRAQVAAAAAEQQTLARLGVPFPPASAPGEAPHRRTGALQRSVKFVVRLLLRKIRIAGSAAAPYARFLQRGTRKMLKRPFIGLPADRRLITDILTGRRRS